MEEILDFFAVTVITLLLLIVGYYFVKSDDE
jgi:hypothetical protein